jgi:3-dehydroquinate synthetase
MQNSEVPTQHKIKLLYGHAIGHALEMLANGRLRHGDAVSIGITIEGAIACLLKIWNKTEWKKQTQLLEKLSLPILVPKKYKPQAILEKMKLYKKLVTYGAFAFVLPQKIGQVATTHQDNFLTCVKQNEFLELFNQALLFIHKNF